MKLNVLIVDDSVVFRKIVSDALSSLPNINVVGTAGGGKMALIKLKQLNPSPDLLILDIEMPEA